MNNEEFQRYYRDIVTLIFQYTNRHHSLWPNPVGTEIHKRKNALLYRCHSTAWHLSLVENLMAAAEHIARDPKNNSELHILLRYKLDEAAFLFDDVIFNLISMFDYLVALLGLIITGNRDEWYKWNQLVKVLRENDKGFPMSSKNIIEIHNNWVDKIAGYRSGIYHRKTDRGSAEFVDDFVQGGSTIRFFIPKQACKCIPIFKDKEHIDLATGLQQLLNHSLQMQYQVLEICINEDT